MFIRFQLETGSHKIYYLATWKKLCLTLTLTLTLNNSIMFMVVSISSYDIILESELKLTSHRL